MEKKILIRLDSSFWWLCLTCLILGSFIYSKKVNKITERIIEGVS